MPSPRLDIRTSQRLCSYILDFLLQVQEIKVTSFEFVETCCSVMATQQPESDDAMSLDGDDGQVTGEEHV